ncbi:MAG: RadC family protein [Chitinophagaceae bacterium]|jgi:DNA repair protein RadC
MKTNNIKNWSEDDRPREKLMLKGIDALSNSELLAIIINNGTKDKSAVDVAKELLQKCNNSLHNLSKLSVAEIIKLKVKGIGNAKAISILSALHLAIRKDSELLKKEKISNTTDAALFFKNLLQHKTIELFCVMYLNTANHVICYETISIGGISGTVVDTRVVLQKAIENKASKIILCHNHPSGNLNPSMADKKVTQQISQAAKLHNIEVLDHLIVSEEGYYSFNEKGDIV